MHLIHLAKLVGKQPAGKVVRREFVKLITGVLEVEAVVQSL